MVDAVLDVERSIVVDYRGGREIRREDAIFVYGNVS